MDEEKLYNRRNTCDQICGALKAELEWHSETIFLREQLFLFFLGWLLPHHTKEDAKHSHIPDF